MSCSQVPQYQWKKSISGFFAEFRVDFIIGILYAQQYAKNSDATSSDMVPADRQTHTHLAVVVELKNIGSHTP